MLQLVWAVYGANQDSARILYFSALVKMMIGNFNDLLSPGWVRQLPSMSKETSTVNIDNLKVPSLNSFNEKGFSIQAAAYKEQLKNGINVSVNDKVVKMQPLSLLDLRLLDQRNEPYQVKKDCSEAMKQLVGYYYDSIMKLYKLIPDQQSFDVAVKANIVPLNLGISWLWWHHEIIEVLVASRIDQAGNADMGKETVELFGTLERQFR